MATHSRILAWRSPWTEKPGGLQSMGSRRVGHVEETEHTLMAHWSVFSYLYKIYCIRARLKVLLGFLFSLKRAPELFRNFEVKLRTSPEGNPGLPPPSLGQWGRGRGERCPRIWSLEYARWRGARPGCHVPSLPSLD